MSLWSENDAVQHFVHYSGHHVKKKEGKPQDSMRTSLVDFLKSIKG